MKMRHLSLSLSFCSLMLGTPVVVLTAPALMMGACGGSSGGSGSTGGGGMGGGGAVMDPENLISDFEDPVAATVVQAGTPMRNGYWYSYNDMSATCTQTPANGVAYLPTTPATFPADGTSSTMALHAMWNTCSTWGAGVGADLNQPAVDGGMYTGPKVPYDLTGYTGITFWAMATAGSDTKLRIKLPMTDETKIVDGGNCDEAVVGANKCSDDWGTAFSLPTNGSWTQITISFSDATKFKQEGWGAIFPWAPSHVTSIQIQSSDMGESYDFWVDDMYLTK